MSCLVMKHVRGIPPKARQDLLMVLETVFKFSFQVNEKARERGGRRKRFEHWWCKQSNGLVWVRLG